MQVKPSRTTSPSVVEGTHCLMLGMFSIRAAFCIKEDGWHGVTPATPVAEGVPHGEMGGARM